MKPRNMPKPSHRKDAEWAVIARAAELADYIRDDHHKHITQVRLIEAIDDLRDLFATADKDYVRQTTERQLAGLKYENVRLKEALRIARKWMPVLPLDETAKLDCAKVDRALED